MIKNPFKKQKKAIEEVNRRAAIVGEIVDLAMERRELKDKLNELRNEVLVDIKKEIDSVLKEVEVVNKAIEVNDRKILDSVLFLEDEIGVEESGIYQ